MFRNCSKLRAFGIYISLRIKNIDKYRISMTIANFIEAKTYLFSHFILILISGCYYLTDQSQTELAKAIAQNKGLTSL